VAGVVLRARPSDDGLQRAAEAARVPVLQPRHVNHAGFLECLRALAPSLNLSIAYDQIFRREALASAPAGCLNFHAGRLPLYRGRNVINWALINGELEIGLTAHFVDEGIDTGDILVQRTLPVAWEDTYGDVLARVVDAMPDVVVESVDLVARGGYSVEPQAHLPGTYFAGREWGDEWLDWSDTSVNLHNKVRAISRPGPGARTTIDGKPVIVWRAYCDPAWPKYIATPGQVVGRLPEDGVLVKTGDCTLRVHEVEVGGIVGPPAWRIGTRLGDTRVRARLPRRAPRSDATLARSAGNV
jgi:methionyl-tRNA formyltransferase